MAKSSLLVSLSFFLPLFRDVTAAQVTVFGLGAAEGDFLTESGASVSTAVGSGGVVTLIGQNVSDEFVQHGNFDAVWIESSNGVVFSATGTNYREFMTCTVDRTASHALCSFSNSVGGEGSFTGTFVPTAIPVLATLTESSASETSTQSTASTFSESSSSSVETSASNTLTTPPTLPTSSVFVPSSPPNGQVTLFGLGADEGEFLTLSDAALSTTVGSDGVITVVGQNVHDEFGSHGEFDAVWKESSDGVVFSATGTAYAEVMSCTVDRSANRAACSFSNSVEGQGTFTGTFAPTAIPVLATLTIGEEQGSTATSTSSGGEQGSAVTTIETSASNTLTAPPTLPTSSFVPSSNGQVTLFGLGADEGEFLTLSDASLSTTVGSDGIITVVGQNVHDEFGSHGEFDATWKESSDGVLFSATGTAYAEVMSCTVDRIASSALCTFSNSVEGQSTFTGTFAPTAIPVLATLTIGEERGSAVTLTGSSLSAIAGQTTRSQVSQLISISPELPTAITTTPLLAGASSSTTAPSITQTSSFITSLLSPSQLNASTGSTTAATSSSQSSSTLRLAAGKGGSLSFHVIAVGILFMMLV